MARMFNPPQPGLTLRDAVLPALGLGMTSAGKVRQSSARARSRIA